MFRALSWLLSCLALLLGLATAHADEVFPEPASLRPAVAFWQRVYLDVTTRGGLIHDSRHLGVVYETVDLTGIAGTRKAQRRVKTRKKYWSDVLRRLAAGNEPRNSEERAVVTALEQALDRRPRAKDYTDAAARLRFQLGQRDKFQAGLVRSGAWEAEMRAVFLDAGLPVDLVYLPHVESSFDTAAYSKFGAAGMWQFMRSTGKRFMKVGYVIDERLDPYRSTEAAARLLRDNYRRLKSWPLAITAYNHGTAGMARAKRKLGTSDIGVIARRYKSRTFGFASRNFYAQFLAARSIAKQYQRHFGELGRDRPGDFERVRLPFYVEARHLSQYSGVGRTTLSTYNPALRPPIHRSEKRIPKGYELRLPPGTTAGNAKAWFALIPPEHRHDEQIRSRFHTVRRGETLSRIARLHGTKVSTIVALNGLSNKHRIYPGQVLELLDTGEPRPIMDISAQTAEVRLELADASEAKQPAPVAAAPSTHTKLLDGLEIQTLTVHTNPPKTLRRSWKDTGAGRLLAGIRVEPIEAEPLDLAELQVRELLVGITVARLDVHPLDLSGLASSGIESYPLPKLPPDSGWRLVKGDSVTVYAGETLGHYADWLELPTQKLRRINSLPFSRPIHIGQRLKLDFSGVSRASFLERRVEYHRAIEEDFFASWRVTGTVDHTLRRGESLWALANQVYSVPTWLIHRFNPTADMSRLTPGMQFKIPVVERQASS